MLTSSTEHISHCIHFQSIESKVLVMFAAAIRDITLKAHEHKKLSIERCNLQLVRRNV